MYGDINPSSGNNYPSNEQANGEGRFIKPALRKKLFRLKTIGPLQDTEENNDGSQLKVRRLSLFNWINASCLIFVSSFQKVLGTRDLVSLGVGSCVGTGMYLVSGLVARKIAGPAVILSYAIAGIAALLSGQIEYFSCFLPSS